MRPFFLYSLVFLFGYITSSLSLVKRIHSCLAYIVSGGRLFTKVPSYVLLFTVLGFFIFILLERIAESEARNSTSVSGSISAREQLLRRGSF